MDELIASTIMRLRPLDNFSIDIAKNYLEVLHLIETNDYRLVITDLFIDGISTNDYIELFMNKLPNCALLVLSDVKAPTFRREIEKQGVSEYITLPMTLKELEQKIEKYL